MTFHPRQLLQALCAIMLAAPVHAAEPDALLWLAQKDGLRLYVYGISHFTIEPGTAIPAHVKAALDASHVVISETHVGPARAPAPQELMDAGRNYETHPYALNEPTRARLHQLVHDGWLTSQQLTSMQTYSPLMAARLIGRHILHARKKQGRYIPALDQTYGKGQDEQVLALARAAGKTLVSIEHPMTAYLYWASRCDNEAQNSTLLGDEITAALDDDEISHRATRVPELILLGDLGTLAMLQHASAKKFPGIQLWLECQQTPRNHYWIRRLPAITAEHGPSKVYFMTAGASHLAPESAVKDESLLNLLQRDGFTLQRVLPAAK